jgi:hypothetical protein
MRAYVHIFRASCTFIPVIVQYSIYVIVIYSVVLILCQNATSDIHIESTNICVQYLCDQWIFKTVSRTFDLHREEPFMEL